MKIYTSVFVVPWCGRMEGAFSRWTAHNGPQDVRSYDKDGSWVVENNWSVSVIMDLFFSLHMDQTKPNQVGDEI